MPPSKPAYTVVYDGDCKLCRRSVDTLAKWDRRGALDIIPSQVREVRSRFPWIPENAFDESLQVVRNSDGKTWQGAAAVEELMKAVQGGKRLAWLFAIPFARPVAEKLYRWFAGNRHKFGCSDHCEAQ